ncbi:MAG: hypothetical protein ACLSFZ_04870 [Frisingicoccus sp.]
MIEKIAAENHKPGTGFRRKIFRLFWRSILDMLDAMKAANRMLKPELWPLCSRQ